jgi:anti-sigma B factor antagonist
MWNPFTRRNESSGPGAAGAATATRRPARSPDALREPTPVVQNKIAEINRIGPTAVATFTVTELTQEQGVAMLSDLLDDLAASGATHFVLDIQNVQFMDSACLGCLVEALNRMTKTRGKIALANTATSVQSLFRLTQLDRVFPICADVMAALRAVEKRPGDDE